MTHAMFCTQCGKTHRFIASAGEQDKGLIQALFTKKQSLTESKWPGLLSLYKSQHSKFLLYLVQFSHLFTLEPFKNIHPKQRSPQVVYVYLLSYGGDVLHWSFSCVKIGLSCSTILWSITRWINKIRNCKLHYATHEPSLFTSWTLVMRQASFRVIRNII